MPNCWFLLVKYFVRIDGVVARCRETRLFCKFDDIDPTHQTPLIHMEVIWREKSLSPQSERGEMQTKFPSYPGASRAVTTSNVCNKNNTNDLPIVNEKYNIPQFYRLRLRNI
jgi:hypothetical protein